MPRFMMLMYPNVTEEQYEEGVRAEDAGEMSKLHQTLSPAGGLLPLDGLHPASKGARVTLAGGKPTITDGPFTEAKELVGGYWLIDVKSKEEAVEWASCADQRGRRDRGPAGLRDGGPRPPRPGGVERVEPPLGGELAAHGLAGLEDVRLARRLHCATRRKQRLVRGGPLP